MPMPESPDSKSWPQIEEIFFAAVELPPAQRSAYLAQACGEDAELRREVEHLLAADSDAADFLELPAVAVFDLPDEPPIDVDASRQERPQARRPPRSQFAPGDLLAGRFRIVRFIAAGGMGEVYEAEDGELGQRVAIKTVRPEMAANQVAMERFRREVRLARQVTHPSVCRSFDLFRHQGASGPETTFLSMELLEGETLSERIRRRGRLTPAEALPIVEQITAALAAAHEQGIIHRDLKGSNVVLVRSRQGDRAVVTDFGIARLGRGAGDQSAMTVTGAIMGTPTHMAPEQLTGGEITPATDVYALGVVMYEMVTGRYPFEEDDHWATALKRLSEDPPPPRHLVPELDPRWEEAILRCLRRLPAERLASGPEVSRFLTAPPRARSPRRRMAVAVAAALALTLAAGGAGLYRLWRPPAPAAQSSGEPAIASRRSLAVLGFKDLTGRNETSWLSTALAEMLTVELGAGGVLRTISGETVGRMKLELELPEVPSLAPDTLARVRDHLDADLVVLGSYFARNGLVRIDLRLEDAAAGETLALVTEEERETRLPQLASRLGRRLRAELGIEELSDAVASQVRASHVGEPEAARLHAEGLARLRLFDALGARERLTAAVDLEPGAPLIHSALAAAWTALGYDGEAAGAARRAFELGQDLGSEERLLVTGRYQEASHSWQQAADTYRTLTRLWPDNLEYGLRLGAALTAAGKAEEALDTLEELHRLAAPAGADPRIDLAEAIAAESLSDYRRAQAAAARAILHGETLGARWLLARGHYREARAWWRLGELVAATAAARKAEQTFLAVGDHAGHANTLLLHASLARQEGRRDEAEATMGQALAIHRRIGHQAGVMRALNHMAIHDWESDPAAAEEHFSQALAIARQIDSQEDIARGLNNLAMMAQGRGELRAAQSLYEQAVAITRAIGDRHGEMIYLFNLGTLLRRRGELAATQARYEESLVIARELGDRKRAGSLLNNLGRVQRQRGDLAGAQASYEGSLAIARQLGDPRLIGLRLNNLAFLLHKRGDLAMVRRLYEEALGIFRQIDDPQSRAAVLNGLGNLCLARNELTEARRRFAEELVLRRKHGPASMVPAVRTDLARLALAKDRPEEAVALAREVLSECSAPEHGDMALAARTVLAAALLRQGRLREAGAVLAEAAELAAATEDLELRLHLELVAARVEAAGGEAAAAQEKIAQALVEAGAAGLGEVQLELRLALGEIALAVDPDGEGKTHLTTLATDAAAQGFARLAAQARETLAAGSDSPGGAAE